jgi:hypothetical protein
MRKEQQQSEISVKPVYTGKRSLEQAFIDLIRSKMTNAVDSTPNKPYTKEVVYPDVHARKKGGTH